jgi:predicted NAD-dependent protein-ADP-ribosyltransferase YbiA (DUF1768 family)
MMKTIFRGELIILIPETATETESLTGWKAAISGHVLALPANSGSGVSIRSLGVREEVCREPIQVSSRSADPMIRLIGNLAATAFELNGVRYASVEGFWQGLKFPEGKERERVAGLVGLEAKRAGKEHEYGESVSYNGAAYRVGTWEHWQLMKQACLAKFTQNFEAQAALLGTGERPLIHKMRRDSKTIPGVIMAEIWMKIREKLRKK